MIWWPQVMCDGNLNVWVCLRDSGLWPYAVGSLALDDPGSRVPIQTLSFIICGFRAGLAGGHDRKFPSSNCEWTFLSYSPWFGGSQMPAYGW